MAKKHDDKNIRRIPPFHEMPSFDPSEFITAFSFAMNAATKTAIITRPEKMGINLLHEDGSVQEIRFNDTPSVKLHPAPIEAAAAVCLKRDGNFSRKEFLRKAREITDTKYKGEQ